MEIGSAALNILVECWDGHLTPPEVASLADRASRARDPNMVRAAAELALSCLPHAHALNPNEIQRALVQCKEQVRIKQAQNVFPPQCFKDRLLDSFIAVSVFCYVCISTVNHEIITK